MLIAAEFFRITIALVLALCVGAVVAVLAYYVRQLHGKIELLEDVIDQVGSREYLEWVLDQTEELELQPESERKRGHLWLVPVALVGWMAERFARQPLAVATTAAVTAVVASMATAPSPGDPETWTPPAAAEEAPATAPLLTESPIGRAFASSLAATTTTSSIPTTTTMESLNDSVEPTTTSTTTTTLLPLPSVETTLPTLPPTTLVELPRPCVNPVPVDLSLCVPQSGSSG